MNEGRMRKKVADQSEWKRVKTQKLRMKGQAYLGFSRNKHNAFKHNIIRSARKLEAGFSSKMCSNSKRSFCGSISEVTRK